MPAPELNTTTLLAGPLSMHGQTPLQLNSSTVAGDLGECLCCCFKT